MPRTATSSGYIVREGFAVPGPDGVPEVFLAGDVLPVSHRLIATHKHFLRPITDQVERAAPTEIHATQPEES